MTRGSDSDDPQAPACAAAEGPDLDLEKLHLLLRLSRDLAVLDPRAFGHAVAEIDTAGRMVGGWVRSLRSPS